MKRRGGARAIVSAVVLLLIIALVGGLFLTKGFGNSQIAGGLSSFEKGLGLLSSQTSSVQITGVTLLADSFDGSSPLSPTCGATSMNSNIAVNNAGAGSAYVRSVTITYGGADNVFEVEGPCTVGPSGSPTSTLYVLFPGPSELPNSSAPEASEPFLGTLNLSNGADLPFSGNFQQGYPRPFASVSSLIASEIATGKPNATCQYSPSGGLSYLEISNSGTVGLSVSQITVTWNSTSITLPISGSCNLGPYGTQASSVYVIVAGVTSKASAPTSGEAYTATATLNSGAIAPITVQFNGTFV